jgi:ATP-dependent DNA helicase RecG
VVRPGPTAARAAPEGLQTPLQYLRGVGPARARQLERLGLRTVEDALFFVPARHEDRTRLTPLRALTPGATQLTAATVAGVSPPPRGRPRVPFSATLQDASGYAVATWFNAPYLERVLARGQRLVLYGRVERYQGRITLQHPEFEIVEDAEDETLHTGRLVPIHHGTEGLSKRWLRSLLWRLVSAHAKDMVDPLPDALRARRRLPGLAESLQAVHFPGSEAALAAAKQRLAFDDFLLLQLGLAILRERTTRARGIAMNPPGELVRRLRATLPFSLTRAQKRVWSEIRTDMASPHPMHRLLQGDVGSGKTVVAAMAVLTAVEAGYQAAVMAPTEILAEQHLQTFERLLGPLGVPIALLTSAVKGRERAERLRRAASGELHCVVGTHALVEEGVEFRRLGLTVVDEQHRFGVEQRARLRAKGEHPDLLVMTATPIPRTLALTLYGDLDVSVLDELPPGRRPVVTVQRTDSARPRVYEFIRKEVATGRQAYVIYPLVEESAVLDLRAATAMAERLRTHVFPDLTVGLLHGRLRSAAKDDVMRRFKAGEIQILVSTTVIEVGIDVPNASIMLIEHAERFGLSQLHQLRGRVGRGPWKSYCVLMTGPNLTEEAQRRITAMTETTDGFRIAEADLELRGPGEFFGTRQSGLPEFRVADLVRDVRLLDEAREEALEIVAADPELREPPHHALRAALLARWRGKLGLASAG